MAQFNRTNPAISRFNANVQYGDQARRLDEQQFEQRRQREQAAGVDTALREGVGAIYAQQPQPQAPVEPVGPTVRPPVQITPAVMPAAAPQNAGMASPNVVPIANADTPAVPAAPAPAPAASAPTARPA